MRNCRSVADLLGAYIYGDLTPDEMRRVRTHIEECDACARELETRSHAVALVPNDLPTLSDEERQRVTWAVKGALRARGEAVPFRLISPGSVRGLAVAAVVVAAFAAGIILGSKSPKVFARQVPANERPSRAGGPTDRVADTPKASVNVRAVPPEPVMAVGPSRRDRIREVYRHKDEKRAEVTPPKLSPAVPEENLEHQQVRPEEENPGANLVPAPVPPDGGALAPPDEGKGGPVLTPPKIRPDSGRQQ
jgi:hypothetical protein